MDSNLPINSNNNAQAQSTDWAEVRDFYLTCRSYKQTAEHFGLTMTCVRSRCYREKWAEYASENTQNKEAAYSPDMQTSELRYADDTQKEDSAYSPDMQEGALDTQSAYPAYSPDTQTSELRYADDMQKEDSAYSPDMQEGTLDTQSAYPAYSPDTQNKASCISDAMSVPSASSLAVPSTCFPPLPMRKNLISASISFGQPWEQRIIAHDKLRDKAAYRAYITSPTTQDCLFSGILGMNKHAMVSRENPAVSMIAVVADYDMQITDEERMKKTAKLTIKPNFISTSYSGGTHAVWFLEAPLPLMPNAEMVQALLETIVKKLKIKNAYGQLDGKAFYNTSQYYHAGWNWQQISEAPIAESMSLLWLDEALKKSKFTSTGVQIPLARIWEEMQKRGWDKRWPGAFELGARGVRFWDPMADCPTAAIVRENGMICFTGPSPFQSWQDIFGNDFIEAFRADTFGKALSECYMVNNSFYVCNSLRAEDGSYKPCILTYNRQNFELLAMARYNISSKPEQEGEESPLKQLMSKIIDLNSLPAACPFIYRKERIIHIQGEPRLNTSFLRVHEPDLSKGRDWGDGFPWIAAFMERLFPDIIQRERFMAAWAYAYRNAYKGEPKNGHTIFIAGPVGGGKNFLTECLFGVSMGGYADASEYILGQTRFNDHLMGVGVWTLNDTVSKGDYRERNIFAKALKKMAANHFHSCEGKFKSATGIYWSGRIMVTLNTDPDSLQLLPDIELSNRDKISLFKTSDEPMSDVDGAAKAKAEMGALCSYLLNWEIPEHCEGDARWGVRNYLHPELLAEASDSSPTASFREILSLFVKDSFEADKSLLELSGSATWFMQQMLQQDGISNMIQGEVSARSIGRRMSALASSGDFPLQYRRKTKERIWSIKRKAFMEYLNNPATEGEVDEFFPF